MAKLFGIVFKHLLYCRFELIAERFGGKDKNIYLFR